MALRYSGNKCSAMMFPPFALSLWLYSGTMGNSGYIRENRADVNFCCKTCVFLYHSLLWKGSLCHCTLYLPGLPAVSEPVDQV